MLWTTGPSRQCVKKFGSFLSTYLSNIQIIAPDKWLFFYYYYFNQNAVVFSTNASCGFSFSFEVPLINGNKGTFKAFLMSILNIQFCGYMRNKLIWKHLSSVAMTPFVVDAAQTSVFCFNKGADIALTLVLLNPDIHCLCKQCRSRSVGFWRSQLIWIYIVCH